MKRHVGALQGVHCVMADDLVNDLQGLSLSVSFTPVNKKPFKVIGVADEFAASFSPFKASFRVLLNYKDMNSLQLKAGSLVRLRLDGRTILPNVFECWPSVIVSQACLGMGSESLTEWLGSSGSVCDFMSLMPVDAPFHTAKRIQIEMKKEGDHLSTEEMQTILKWLDSNRFLSAKLSWYFVSLAGNEEGKVLRFGLKCVDSEVAEEDVVRYAPEQTKLVQHKSSSTSESVNWKFGGFGAQVKEMEDIFKRVLVVSVSSTSNDNDRAPSAIKESRGVLLYGPPGTGKTLMIRYLTTKYNLPVLSVTASDFSHAGFGEAEAKLKEVFDAAQKMAPSVIFMDEIDSLCPKRDSHSSAASIRLTTLLLTLMDGFISRSPVPVLFVGATNAVNSLDPALRRPGRFDREIEIPPPNRDDRLAILSALLKGRSHSPASSISEQELGRIADICHGFVGADLSLLCKEAFLAALLRCQSSSLDLNISVTYDDFIMSLSKVKPNAMREVFVEVPKTKWTDIGGQHETKQKLIECVEWPIKYPDRFERLGIRPPKGVLLFGPPGCSKTLLAKALASESGLNFLAVKGPEIFSKYVGESEKKIQDIFKKARQASPAIIFFDEFDSIAGRSAGTESSNSVADRVMSQLLNEMDGIESLVNVIVIAATNKPDLIDKALLRPGRFDRHIYIAPPDFEGRAEIFKIIARKMPFDPAIDPEDFAKLTEGFTGAELTSVCQNAALKVIERDINCRKISFEDLSFCISKFEKQLNPESLKIFDKFIE